MTFIDIAVGEVFEAQGGMSKLLAVKIEDQKILNLGSMKVGVVDQNLEVKVIGKLTISYNEETHDIS